MHRVTSNRSELLSKHNLQPITADNTVCVHCVGAGSLRSETVGSAVQLSGSSLFWHAWMVIKLAVRSFEDGSELQSSRCHDVCSTSIIVKHSQTKPLASRF